MATTETHHPWGQIHSAEEENTQQQAARDPARYHGEIAARELHWFHPEKLAWLSKQVESGAWAGYESQGGKHTELDAEEQWCPWDQALDDARAPFYSWFVGAQTNACFNEVDRHVLSGRGRHTAIAFEGDRWDPSKNDGKGGPVSESTISYRELLYETVLRAQVLKKLGLKKGDRVAFNLPNIPEQIFYIEAAKRLGVIYTPVFGGFSAKTLSDRIYDAGAEVVITADGGYRNAEVVPYKEAFTDKALDSFIPLAGALAALEQTLASFSIGAAAARILEAAKQGLAGEITIERSDLMREVGAALRAESGLSAEVSAELRTTIASGLADVHHIVRKVVVVTHTGQRIVEQSRDVWSNDLLADVQQELWRSVNEAGYGASGVDELNQLEDQAFWATLNAANSALPVESDWPAFIMYTSGSTGKPKGVVHTHGGWLSGITHTLRVVFGATPEDKLYVVADPGWITGQSYLIAAPFSLGMTSIVAEGSPLFPHAGRFASIIERHGATLFKAGSTFLKAVMTDSASTEDMSAYDMSSVRVATFCAEPVSPAVQQFAMDWICKRYINSYWATEHGGIVLTCPYGDLKPLKADAMTWSLPWINAEVRVPETDQPDHVNAWRLADTGEKGELVLTSPYPYLARTIWGDAENLGSSQWQGDIERFTETYFSRWAGELAYTQGDFARMHPGGGITLHGRSDDVINVSGHRIGTEEIEGAILRDKVLRENSPVGNAVVVGAPHDEKGETPVAFLTASPGAKLNDDDINRLKNLVRTEKGVTAVPSDFLVVSEIPETRSGKYMRRTLRAVLLDLPLGDLSTLRNPEVIAEIEQTVADWKAHGQLHLARDFLHNYRYLSVQNHLLEPGKSVAVLTINTLR